MRLTNFMIKREHANVLADERRVHYHTPDQAEQKCETEVILWCERGCVRDKGAMPAAESGAP